MKPLKLTGIGLRTQHHQDVLEKRPTLAWLEIHTENYFAEGGKALYYLDQICQHYPISLHGVGLSLGSADELNWQHLKKIRDLKKRINACLVSDHLSWSSINGQYFHDLLPLPFTEESLTHVVTRIQQVQDYLQSQLLIENIANYVTFSDSVIPEGEFLREVAIQSGCGILLDISNIYVNATNHGFNPKQFLSLIPANCVHEFHLAGFNTMKIQEKEILIDSHDQAIVPAVWDLFREAVKLLGTKPTIIEWDTNLPQIETLCLEAFRAEQIMRDVHVATKLAG
ncbi:MAG: hypothetical protein ACD_46C00327G0011 [uncultured bacterium]|nr:MAG: hypothetical protein ACD_46C00327G0011 [uncultured bacterium]